MQLKNLDTPPAKTWVWSAEERFWSPILLEMWYAEGVVASLTFHPVEKFLVIAKYNQLFFWDWENQEPKLKVEHSTRN